MPNAEPGTDAAAAGTAAPAETPESPLAGFSQAIQGWGDPQQADSQPEEPKAVETSAEVEAPKPDAEKPAGEKPAEPAKVEEKPDAAKTVNFDGFSDKQKTTYERLLKAGLVTPEEVEEGRKSALRQADYTRKTMALAEERKALAAEREAEKANLALLEKIRGDERLLAMWDRMRKAANGEVAAVENPDDLADRRTADEIARKAIEDHERRKQAEVERERVGYEKRAAAVKEVLGTVQVGLGVDPETLDGYLTEIAKRFPAGVDPIRHIIRNVDPESLREKIEYQHEIARAKAEAAAAREAASKVTSKQVQASKQSLSPSPRVVEAESNLSPFQRAKRELGITRLSEVQGAGFPTNGR